MGRSQLLYSEPLGLVLQEAAQPSTTIVPQEAAQQNTKKGPLQKDLMKNLMSFALKFLIKNLKKKKSHNSRRDILRLQLIIISLDYN